MRRNFLAATLLTIALFITGFVAGQVLGITPSSAAGVTPTQTATAPSTAAAGLSRHADGTVTAISGDTVTIKADADRSGSNEYTGVTTVNLTSTTQYGSSQSKASIKVGSYLIAEGTLSTDGTTLTATTISAGSGARGSGCNGGPHA
ncbi:MAG TPA: hypothetical protein DEV93_20250 [Chloroflexi bacterium]|jgi:hypothetical protein|nr:hypothetical protein [Chloroflexota bacterium]